MRGSKPKEAAPAPDFSGPCCALSSQLLYLLTNVAIAAPHGRLEIPARPQVLEGFVQQLDIQDNEDGSTTVTYIGSKTKGSA